MMTMTDRRALLIGGCSLLLTGCFDSGPPAKPKEPEKPPETVTGQTSFWKMYTMAARTWSQDVQALSLESVRLQQLEAKEGKFPAWAATFVSPSKSQSRMYTYSVIEAGGNLHKDVFAGLAETYAQHGQQRPWPIQAFKIDSDKAYQVAVEHSAEYIKKNPDKPVTFLLELTPRHPNLAWRVIWGDSIASSNYSVYVDASTGAFLERMR